MDSPVSASESWVDLRTTTSHMGHRDTPRHSVTDLRLRQEAEQAGFKPRSLQPVTLFKRWVQELGPILSPSLSSKSILCRF